VTVMAILEAYFIAGLGLSFVMLVADGMGWWP
jgi:hypothetical protein